MLQNFYKIKTGMTAENTYVYLSCDVALTCLLAYENAFLELFCLKYTNSQRILKFNTCRSDVNDVSYTETSLAATLVSFYWNSKVC